MTSPLHWQRIQNDAYVIRLHHYGAILIYIRQETALHRRVSAPVFKRC